MYAKDLSEPKDQFLIKKCEKAKIMIRVHLFSTQTQWMKFMRILMTITQVEKKNLIVFDDMIAGVMTNKRFQTVIKELFIRCRKLNILLSFITQSYFFVPKVVRLNSAHYLIIKINSQRELQNIGINYSADID